MILLILFFKMSFITLIDAQHLTQVKPMTDFLGDRHKQCPYFTQKTLDYNLH